MVNQTIEQVVKKGLCTGCGTCVSICPTKAVTIKLDNRLRLYFPQIDSTKCHNCSQCYSVCPGESVNFKQLSKNVYKQQLKQPNSILLGTYTGCYVGYSTDKNVRFNSASGGIVSQLLICGLEAGLIDGAIVTRMSKNVPLEPEPFIARTREEVLEACSSKYCPVPLNIVLKEVLLKDGRYAFVGLPCHIHGLRKAQQLNKKLRERIVLTIGIFCSHNDNFSTTNYVLSRLNVTPSNVASITYRGSGWAGAFTVKQKSGEFSKCAFHEWIKVHEYCFFTPDRCLLCCDHTAELSDISTGDAWLPEFSKDRYGVSIFVSRNDIGDKYVLLAKSKGHFSFSKIDSQKVVKSQGNIRFKKNGFAVRCFVFRLQRKNIPIYDAQFPKTDFVEIPRSAIIFINRFFASKNYSNKNIDRLIHIQACLKKLYTMVT
ncbi:MAG: Coenzyme F420 hydrogenase/dehydrogenase, beta subunit C-terminal domain [Nitrososphaerota archaeon]|nr:Coenzyme F420 hydrogenase/dehydrogenase, beta subunit C-terminal domain [Nitrososphaerota archaeon]